MAKRQSSRSGFPTQPRLAMAEVVRIVEMAYRHAAWLDLEGETPEEFADSVLSQFEALLADHAERAGYPIRCAGFGSLVAEDAVKVPFSWRPGWPWPGRFSRGVGVVDPDGEHGGQQAVTLSRADAR